MHTGKKGAIKQTTGTLLLEIEFLPLQLVTKLTNLFHFRSKSSRWARKFESHNLKIQNFYLDLLKEHTTKAAKKTIAQVSKAQVAKAQVSNRSPNGLENKLGKMMQAKDQENHRPNHVEQINHTGQVLGGGLVTCKLQVAMLVSSSPSLGSKFNHLPEIVHGDRFDLVSVVVHVLEDSVEGALEARVILVNDLLDID